MSSTGICNGLVLVCAYNRNLVDTLVLLNPTTKEIMKLPHISDLSYIHAYRYIHIDRLYGLGYYDDSETGNDFKVVFLTCLHETVPATRVHILVHVYSLKTNTWRQLTNSVVDYCSIARLRESVFANGFLHWIATKTVNGLESTVILAFSLADDKFSEVPTPEFGESTPCYYFYLVLLGGKLALFNELISGFWLMNEYGIKESWTKILLHEIPMVIRDSINNPIVFYHDGKFMMANSDWVMLYDDENKIFEETVCVWDRENFKVTGSFVESLVSIASYIEQ